MCPLRRLTVIDQTAAHLREGIAAGKWTTRLPAMRPLSAELGVSTTTLAKAIRRLETEGVLPATTDRHARRLHAPTATPAARPLRVAILLNHPMGEASADLQNVVLKLRSGIQESGHTATLIVAPHTSDTAKTGRLARLVATAGVDAWILVQAPSEVVAWFAAREELPALAYAGRGAGLPIASAGADATAAMRETVGALVALGHRRIVCLCPARSLDPSPAPFVVAFRSALAAAGITPGEYHTPHWEETPEGARTLLDNLFRVTPPTAILAMGNLYVAATLAFTTARGLRIPEDVSIVSADADSAFPWYRPGLDLAHFDDRREAVLRRIVRWVEAVSTGTQDRSCRLSPAVLVPGNSVGPAPRS